MSAVLIVVVCVALVLAANVLFLGALACVVFHERVAPPRVERRETAGRGVRLVSLPHRERTGPRR